MIKFILLVILLLSSLPVWSAETKFGIEQTELLQKVLTGKKIGLVVNQASIRNGMHTIDRLLELKFKISKLYALEHGVRGKSDAGEDVDSGVDEETGIPVISVFDEHKKPTPTMLKNLDVLVFDIQDVGARFFTYISSLGYFLEAAAENKIPILVLDRPNPNLNVIAGPVLNEENKSFVGLYPLPVLYGLSIGELAKMIQGEHWMHTDGLDLTVVFLEHFQRNSEIVLEKFPSPNLRSPTAIRLYPSLVFFEGTAISVGRGTDQPFLQFGAPVVGLGKNRFTPESGVGTKSPLYEDELCYGENLGEVPQKELPTFSFRYFLEMQARWKTLTHKKFVTNPRMLELLVGNKAVVAAILKGESEAAIESKFLPDLQKFLEKRRLYLHYRPF